jgi:hypothetical protein
MAETKKKSHFGLGFFIGFVSCLVVLVAAVAITGYSLYNQYEPKAAEKEEGLFEDYTNAIVTPILAQKSGLTVRLDYKYVTWDNTSSVYTLHLCGKATTAGVTNLSDFTLEVTLAQKSDYDAIANNLKTGADPTKDLAPNYGAIGLYYITNGCAQEGVKFKTLLLGDTAWSLI